MTPHCHRTSGEHGFVLVSAIWLLLLGAAVVAVIQLTVLNRAKVSAFDREQTEHRLALESAYETAVADILFNGPRSNFARLPAQTDYMLNSKAMQVQIASESGKLDVNQADPALIDRALTGLGIDPATRTAFLGKLAVTRTSGANIATTLDLVAAFRDAGPGASNVLAETFCATQYLTIHSGLPRPLSGQMPPQLARSIGEPNLPTDMGFQPGSALRIAVTAQGGPPLTAVVRITGRLDQAIDVLDWRISSDCTTSSVPAA